MTNAEFATQIEDALREVPDPETGLNIVDMGLVYDIDADASTGVVALSITFTSPACPVGPALVEGIERRLSRLTELRSTSINVTFDPPWTPERITEAGRDYFGYEP